MRIGVWIKRKTLAALPPVVLLALGGFFIWSATQGDRGSNGYVQRQQDQRAAQSQLTRAEQDFAAWERRVNALKDKGLQLDALDERVRGNLNLSDPNDIILLYPSGQKLF